MKQFTGFEGRSALVVDDHDISRDYVSAALRQSGMAVKAVGSVAAAVRAAGSLPGLVVSDWRLPDGNGRDVCDSIRSAWPSNAALPRFVLLCARPEDAPPDWLAKAGIHRVLRKPCSPRALLEAVRPDGWGIREGTAPGLRDNDEKLLKAVRSELRARLPGLAAAVDGKRLRDAGLISHQLTASAALCRARALESALRELGELCSEGADSARTAATWCSLESAVQQFLVDGRP